MAIRARVVILHVQNMPVEVHLFPAPVFGDKYFYKNIRSYEAFKKRVGYQFLTKQGMWLKPRNYITCNTLQEAIEQENRVVKILGKQGRGVTAPHVQWKRHHTIFSMYNDIRYDYKKLILPKY